MIGIGVIGYGYWGPNLVRKAARFVDCIERAATPVTDGHAGRRVIRLLEAASASMLAQGRLAHVQEPGYAL